MKQSERPQPALGKAIRQLRESCGMTQTALAEKAGLTGRTVSAIETGRANPTWATISDIADALGVSIAEIAKAAQPWAK
jgi:putative transcriptional regulator